MNIEEVKAAKVSLESAIAELLQQFSADTGTAVDRIETDTVLRLGNSPRYIVRVEVRL
jgi:kynureninase